MGGRVSPEEYFDLGSLGEFIGLGSPMIATDREAAKVSARADALGADVATLNVGGVRSRSEFAIEAASALGDDWATREFADFRLRSARPAAMVVFVHGLEQLIRDDLGLAVHVVVVLHRRQTALQWQRVQFEPVYVLAKVPTAEDPSDARESGVVAESESTVVLGDDEAVAFVARHEDVGWNVVHIDVSAVNSTIDFFVALKEVLWFPSWCGSNWNSFDDASQELGEAWAFPMLLVISGLREMLTNDLHVGLHNLVLLDENARGFSSEGAPFKVAYPVL